MRRIPTAAAAALAAALGAAVGLLPAAAVPGAGVGVLRVEVDGGASLGPVDNAGLGGLGTALGPTSYGRVEEAGLVERPGEYSVDGWIDRFKDGDLFGQLGSVVDLRMKSGHAAKPGADYVIFREDGEVGGGTGMLLENVGVLRVIRVRGREVEGRVIKQYANILVKDRVRLRAPLRAAYEALLARAPSSPPKALKGRVVGVLPPTLFAVDGDVVYLNLGVGQGVFPGLRLTVVGDQAQAGFGGGDDDSGQPMGPIADTVPASDDIGAMAPTGAIAVVEVVNASSHACAARVLRCVGEVRIGDPVRYP